MKSTQAREMIAAAAAPRRRCLANPARWRTSGLLRNGVRLNRLGSPGWRLRRPA